MEEGKEEFGTIFTTTAVPDDIRRAAGLAPGAACKTPRQLGVGVPGGAEIAVLAARLMLELNPFHAIFSDDKKNGFNCISRKAIFRGLWRWLPRLVPAARLWYSINAHLFTHGKAACDEDGELYFSYTGCQQGDSLAPLLFAIGYHETLLTVQAHHPTVDILAYLDDTYIIGVVAEAHAALLTGERVALELCNVESNRSKQEVYSQASPLEGLPATLRGTALAPANPARGYAGGRLPGFKMLGAFIGEPEWCSARLVERVELALAHLPKVSELRDSPTVTTALQCSLIIARYCANTTLSYFLRCCPPDVTEAAARRHDELVSLFISVLVRADTGTAEERGAALEQARLPVRMGGLGVTPMFAIRPAAWIGSFALCWRPILNMFPSLAGVALVGPDGGDEGGSSLSAVRALRAAYRGVLAGHADVTATYVLFDSRRHDFDVEGEPRLLFHPNGLPPAKTILPLSEYGSPSITASKLLQHAQRRLSMVTHHLAWIQFVRRASRNGLRESVHSISVSQPYAGAFLNAIPSRAPFRMPTWAMRTALLRRLGLPMPPTVPESRLSRSGRTYDRLGDVAQNDARHGHAGRHADLLSALGDVLRPIFGGRLQIEPESYLDVSAGYKPDLLIYSVGPSPTGILLGDLKLFDCMAADVMHIGRAGATVGFGNTLMPAREKMLGHPARGDAADDKYDPQTGNGRLEPKRGDYHFAQAKKHIVYALLFETFGGFAPDTIKLLDHAARQVQNKLNAHEYDLTTWSARSWKAYATQQLSVRLHKAAAWELGQEAGFGVGAD